MNFQDFQDNCLVTFKKDGKELSLAHAILGINSELNELEDAIFSEDIVNISEEICDILYYVVVYCYYRGFSLEVLEYDWESIHKNPKSFPISKGIGTIMTTSSKLADLAKKFIFYGREVMDEEELTKLATLLFITAKSYEIDLNVGFDRLINKLRVRYEKEFNAEKANNRDLETERRVLEGK